MCKYGKGNSDFPEVGWPVNSQAIPNRTLACYCNTNSCVTDESLIH